MSLKQRWLQEERRSITDPDELAEHLEFTPKELKQLRKVCGQFQMKITPYYLNLIDPTDHDDPLRIMAVPGIKELNVKKGELHDPIGDTNPDLKNQPVQAITHRYPDRVLLYPTPRCSGYCRHCFRRRLAGKSEFQLTGKQMDAALDYIRDHKEIHEVIFTGGDPLMLTDKRLDTILEIISKMEHIWTIRIHTRMPVWNPYRITPELVDILAKYKPLWIVTHFNHARELTEVSRARLALLIDSGIPVLNQAVLLKGVNDSLKDQRDLSYALIKSRVKPYYLHQLDKAKGISHFRVGIRRGLKILREMRGQIPGYAIPHYILDIPGGYGKIPMQYHYLSSHGDGKIIVETPEGDLRAYHDGVENKDKGEMTGQQVDGEIRPAEFYPDEIQEQIEELEE